MFTNIAVIAFTTTCILQSAVAFITNNIGQTNTLLKMSETSIESIPSEMVVEEEMNMMLPDMSQSIPFLERPLMLTGELPGDVGFDPLDFARTREDLMNYREAEIKHARLAMLAAAGWPLSEIFDKKIALKFDLEPLLDAGDRVPSLLNGGLGKVSPLYWIVCIFFTAAIEFYGIMRSKSVEGYRPGDLGFDPLGLLPDDEEGKKRMELAEIKHGRLAMIAIVAFAIQEAVSNTGVVNETPLFFFPLM